MRKILLISIVLLLSGCASSVPLQQDIRNSITTVSISLSDKKPELFYQGAEDIAAREKFFASNNIDIKKMIRTELMREIEEKKIFRFAKKGQSDANIEIYVNVYGFGLGGEFMNFYIVKPLMNASIKLTDKTGKEIWVTTEFITNTSGLTDKVDIRELKDKPEVVKKSLRHASRIVAKLLATQIEGREATASELVKIDKM